MTPVELAQLHAAANDRDRPWTAREFSDLLTGPGVRLWTAGGGFALTRTVAGESELLTIAVAPQMRRRGIARRLVHDWLEASGDQSTCAFLEVAADNVAARHLYDSIGFTMVGTRPRYYARRDAAAADALVMRLELDSPDRRE